ARAIGGRGDDTGTGTVASVGGVRAGRGRTRTRRTHRSRSLQGALSGTVARSAFAAATDGRGRTGVLRVLTAGDRSALAVDAGSLDRSAARLAASRAR